MNTGILGERLNAQERHAMIRREFSNDAAIRQIRDLGMNHQCRCGGTKYCWKRKRFYCIACGRWVKRFAIPLVTESAQHACELPVVGSRFKDGVSKKQDDAR